MSSGKALAELRRIDPYEFEQLVADVWEQRGWDTTVTTGSADRGIDIIARKESPIRQKHLIQAKRFAEGNKIGSPDIQQYSSLRQQEGDVDSVIIVTTSSFTPQAERTATDLNVKMVDGEELLDMMDELDMRYSVGRHSVSQSHNESVNDPQEGDVNDYSDSQDSNASTETPPPGNPWKFKDYEWDSCPTQNHDYFQDCPLCDSHDSVWHGQRKDKNKELNIYNEHDKLYAIPQLLKCDNCDSEWVDDESYVKKDGADNRDGHWKLIHPSDHALINEKMTTRKWKMHPVWKKGSHPWDTEDSDEWAESIKSEHKYFNDCPICHSQDSIWYASSDTGLPDKLGNTNRLKCNKCGSEWWETGGLISTKWKIAKFKGGRESANEEVKTTSGWKKH